MQQPLHAITHFAAAMGSQCIPCQGRHDVAPQHGCHADLQVALDKHCNDILCLLRTKSPANQGAILQKLLTKIHAVNMGTMVGIDDSIARTGDKALTVIKLKEVGSKAECETWRVYAAGEDGNIPLDRADAAISDNQPPPPQGLSKR